VTVLVAAGSSAGHRAAYADDTSSCCCCSLQGHSWCRPPSPMQHCSGRVWQQACQQSWWDKVGAAVQQVMQQLFSRRGKGQHTSPGCLVDAAQCCYCSVLRCAVGHLSPAPALCQPHRPHRRQAALLPGCPARVSVIHLVCQLSGVPVERRARVLPHHPAACPPRCVLQGLASISLARSRGVQLVFGSDLLGALHRCVEGGLGGGWSRPRGRMGTVRQLTPRWLCQIRGDHRGLSVHPLGTPTGRWNKLSNCTWCVQATGQHLLELNATCASSSSVVLPPSDSDMHQEDPADG